MSTEPKANIQVGVRVRPLLQKEKLCGETEQWIVTPTSIRQKDPKLVVTSSCYSFNCVFNEEADTEMIYNKLVKPMVISSLDGYNVTIFAYGQTCSGKTYTIRGEELGKDGLISLAINEICKAINECSNEEECTVRASYMEIYNEVITDLLEPSKGDLNIHESLSRGVFVEDLTERTCDDSKQLFDVFNDGEANRKYGSTKFNEHSSRSHTVFRVLLNRKKADHVCKMSVLNFVDLAGSERAGQGGAQGIRLKEAGFINKSLLTLGKVISELSRKQSHISFRESKLTRLLSSSLGGNSQTCILCTVSPNVLEETHLTLQFADRAMTITNRPKVNEVVLVNDKEMRLQYLIKENEDLKQQIQLYQNTSLPSHGDSNGDSNGAMLGNVPAATILGSMLYFKKRAGEYLDELQKSKKVQAELKWELQDLLNRISVLQSSDKENRNMIRKLEDEAIASRSKHAADLSFAMREQEHAIAELITYDDMESVTKQLDEECQERIDTMQKKLQQLLAMKDLELEDLLNRISVLQSSDKEYQNIIRKLEDEAIALRNKHAADLSFAMREQEHALAELITYDDMEIVTKRMNEDCQKRIEKLQADYQQQLTDKHSELEKLQTDYKQQLTDKHLELEKLQVDYKQQLTDKDMELEDLLNQISVLQSSDKEYRNMIQKLEDGATNLKIKHAADLSFAVRVQESTIADLFTYDDMESVTKQLNEECQKRIETVQKKHQQLLALKDSELGKLQADYKQQLADKDTAIETMQKKHQQLLALKDSELETMQKKHQQMLALKGSELEEDRQDVEYFKTRITYLDTIIERLKKEHASTKRDARDWELEAKKLRKKNNNLEFHLESCKAACKNIGSPHSYFDERLKEQVGVVEAGKYWDIQSENVRLQAEKDNAAAEFERIKQELLRIRKERDIVIKKYKALKERIAPVH